MDELYKETTRTINNFESSQIRDYLERNGLSEGEKVEIKTEFSYDKRKDTLNTSCSKNTLNKILDLIEQ